MHLPSAKTERSAVTRVSSPQSTISHRAPESWTHRGHRSPRCVFLSIHPVGAKGVRVRARVEAMISVSNLEKSYGDRVLFADAAFQLNPGERYGIVGANGSGKTTLLRILSGDTEATRGTVSIPKSARIGVLRQDQFLYEDEEVL